ncbi:enoyl-CoA delta isomerase 2 [Coccinella septempunctata]|uniref:enoyl-CoA delta isomerase 2 n=1 Tax=Coccinella septempunctata TaxID=41139 RepID=UPI001D06A71E|nr:enoyl-CoA delta isomerase 2 [Coccinella septempunctata]XP_044766985.1 enoyl-CoA delta isomerase 2 [Coccinella septempunctata]XP_044766986.1 enoyl-CoA delta isomerase 2 [Coccinella septempunctata]XP_044766987.1 enoyl-CoA delta isomerase 2 [Coccinella septempunctata]
MDVTLENKVRKLVLNRPSKKNAITIEMYENITNILNDDATNDDVIVTIITGKGEYFSSGTDFFSSLAQTEVDSTQKVKEMIDAFINYPKILIAVVNGPAIGIAATCISLCDIIYCSDRATFEIPFIRLGFSLEGCSSLLYPILLGKSKSSEMLFLNHILTANEAYKLGFVAQVVPADKLEEFIKSLLKFGALPRETVIRNKKLLMRWSKEALLKCNEVEKQILDESVKSDDFINALSSFVAKKSKL